MGSRGRSRRVCDIRLQLFLSFLLVCLYILNWSFWWFSFASCFAVLLFPLVPFLKKMSVSTDAHILSHDLGPTRPPRSPAGSSPKINVRPSSQRKPNIPGRPNPKGNANGPPQGARRVIDARALAAGRTGSGQPGNVLRGPKLQLPRGGLQNRPNAKKGKGGNNNAQKTRRPRVPRQFESGEGNREREAEIEAVMGDLAQKARPVQVQYNPQDPTFSTVKETWPSIPSDARASSAGILQKLSSVSERYPNGYVPPHELGRQLYRGQKVQFFNEEEKREALGEAGRLARQRADKLSQKKGELIEPEEVNFEPISAEHQKALVQSLAQGIYPKSQPQQGKKPPVVGNIMNNLSNNQTYQTTGKSAQFLNKFESLLSSGKPAKRA